MLRVDENICNHQISFPIDAGLNDIIKLKFKKYAVGTQVYFAVGPSFERANGQLISDLSTVEILKVGFPNSIFLMIEHPEGSSGDFAFDFWYKDQGTDIYEDEFESIDGHTGYSFVKV